MSQRFPFSLHSLSLFRPFLLLDIHRFIIHFHFPLSQFSFPFILVIFTSSLHKIHKRLSSSLLCCYRRYPSHEVFLEGFFYISVYLDFLCPRPSSAGSDACKCQDYALWSSLQRTTQLCNVSLFRRKMNKHCN